MSNEIGSVQFSQECANYYAATLRVRWDLDFDGAPETEATDVTFSAAQIDGPFDGEIIVEAQHPMDLRTATRHIAVSVRNADPQVASWTLLTPSRRRIGIDVPFALQNQPVTATGRFDDAGSLDHQTASVNWGDGTVSSSFKEFADAFGDRQGIVTTTHAFDTAGTFTTRLTVTDDDAGSGDLAATLTC